MITLLSHLALGTWMLFLLLGLAGAVVDLNLTGILITLGLWVATLAPNDLLVRRARKRLGSGAPLLADRTTYLQVPQSDRPSDRQTARAFLMPFAGFVGGVAGIIASVLLAKNISPWAGTVFLLSTVLPLVVFFGLLSAAVAPNAMASYLATIATRVDKENIGRLMLDCRSKKIASLLGEGEEIRLALWVARAQRHLFWLRALLKPGLLVVTDRRILFLAGQVPMLPVRVAFAEPLDEIASISRDVYSSGEAQIHRLARSVGRSPVNQQLRIETLKGSYLHLETFTKAEANAVEAVLIELRNAPRAGAGALSPARLEEHAGELSEVEETSAGLALD